MSVRLNLTNSEKIAQSLTGIESDAIRMNMAEDIDTIIEREKKNTFNEQVDKYVERFDKHSELLKQYAESFNENMGTIEIKPLHSRILVKPFEHNPFQKITQTESGIIIDTGGFAPEVKNSDTGEMEEAKQFIITGTVVDCGPEVKYLEPGDVVFFRRDTILPVPFFKQGLACLNENQVIATVNEGLSERFNKR